MPNIQYERGRAREYRLVKKLKGEGWPYAQRMAGSHSEFDILGINSDTKQIVLIQSKGGKTGARERKKLEGLKDKYSGTYRVEVEIL